jgi:hypothetical protein
MFGIIGKEIRGLTGRRRFEILFIKSVKIYFVKTIVLTPNLFLKII